VPVGWRPYYDGGHWAYTDQGWYWQSDYPWGDIAFHYGRWSYKPVYGWVWAPGFEFAPAWVVWRHTDEYCGWAPLPFGTVLVGGEWRFGGVRVAVDFDFGLSAGFFSFVACDHFWEHDFRRFIVPRERLVVVFRQSTVINRYHLDHGRFVNEGIRVERMAQLSHRDLRDIKREAARDVRAQEARRNVEERQADRKLAASGHKVQATRAVAAAHPEARSEAEKRTAETSKNSRSAGAERGAAAEKGEAAKTSRSGAPERGAATERGGVSRSGKEATSRSLERSTSKESRASTYKSKTGEGQPEKEREKR
jgi:hypothetical protein